MGKDGVYAELEHVRLVHFTILVASGALLYIYLSVHVWSSTPKLGEELHDLDAVIRRIERTDRSEMFDAWPSIERENENAARDQLQQLTGLSLELRPSLTDLLYQRVTITDLDPKAWADPDFEPLHVTRGRMEQHVWEWTLFDHFEIGTLPELARWGASVSDNATYVRVGSLLDGNDLELIFELEHCHMEKLDPSPNMPAVRVCNTEDGPAIRAHMVTKTDRRSLPPGWFAKGFPTVVSNWDSLQDLTIRHARDELAHEEDAEIYAKKATVLGLDIEGRHLGYMGPLLLLIGLVYLLAYLHQLDSRAKTRPMTSPWLGSMASPAARIISTITLLAAPTASFFMLWAFGHVWWVWSLLAAVPQAAVIALIAILGWRIAEKAEDPVVPPPAQPSTA